MNLLLNSTLDPSNVPLSNHIRRLRTLFSLNENFCFTTASIKGDKWTMTCCGRACFVINAKKHCSRMSVFITLKVLSTLTSGYGARCNKLFQMINTPWKIWLFRCFTTKTRQEHCVHEEVSVHFFFPFGDVNEIRHVSTLVAFILIV